MKKTFNQLKKDLQVGTTIKCIYNTHGKFLNLERTIIKVQTNAVIIETFINGERKESFLWYPPKASQCEYIDNIFTFYSKDNEKLLSYEIIKQ